MPATGSLAALMKEWPLNSVTLFTATHSKLREVLDGTDTQVATLHDQQMDGQDKGSKRIYNQRDLTKREDRNSEDTWKP